MGMAASQARFLGLTARKSNVEYQGQQINQQRTALATESSNLFHQMMSLDVPTPPVTTDYYKAVYTLDGSAFGNSSDYTIENMQKTFGGTNNYTVKLKTTEKATAGTSNTFQFTKVSRTKLSDGQYSYVTKLNGSMVSYNPNDCTAWQSDSSNVDNKVIKASKNKIYIIDSTTRELLEGSNDGYKACVEQMKEDGIIEIREDGIHEKQEDGQYSETASSLYFFQDASGKNCYLTESQLKRITSDAFTENPGYKTEYNDAEAIISGAYSQLYYPYENKTDYYYEVNADVESSSSGRYTLISISDPPEDEKVNYPSNLKGHQFSITCTSEYDEKAYKDAYNDYEYNKNVYEKTISDINNQTEIIQNEDKQLELRLQQLDTEQESISNEMDSVTKVIEDNIQKTFDAFG